MNDRSALPLAERLEVEAKVDAAFAPLRRRRTDLSPLRVRAAVRWGRGVGAQPPAALPWSSVIRRSSELAAAVGMTVVIFGAALGPAGVGARHDTAIATATGARTAGPTLEQQREMLTIKQEWSAALRVRLEVRTTPYMHDVLDPSVPLPAPRVRSDPAPEGTGPY